MPLTASFVAIAPERFGSVYQYGNSGGVFQRGDSLYMVCTNPGRPQSGWSAVSGTPPPILAQARILKSQDGGFTWTEVDVDGGPQVSLQKAATAPFRGIYSPTAACYQDPDTLLVGYFVWDYTNGDPVELRFSVFDMSTDTWGAETSGGPTSSTVTSLGMAQRPSDGATVFMYDGQETVSATRYDRCFFVVYNVGWGLETAVDPAQTGSTNNYSFAGVVPGSASRTHLFYANPDPLSVTPTILKQNTLTSLDALVGPVQITTAVQIGQGGRGPWNWSRATARVLSGSTQIVIGYIKDADGFLYLSKATSANTPVFTENQITAVTAQSPVGVFNIGLALSQGASASAFESGESELIATGSRDLATWDPATIVSPVPFAVPILAGGALEIFGLANGPGIDSSDGFLNAGFVVNTFEQSPG